jgi:hypothetical protein
VGEHARSGLKGRSMLPVIDVTVRMPWWDVGESWPFVSP